MVVITVMTVALMMTWVVPEIENDLQAVDINSADLDELMMLQGIGNKLAFRIISYRQANGPFQQPEDLLKVKGFGEKLFEANQNHLIVSDQR
jgi:competence protein ComEA